MIHAFSINFIKKYLIKMRFVIDNTICHTETNNYEHSKPIDERIVSLRK